MGIKYRNGRRNNLNASSVWVWTLIIMGFLLWGTYELAFSISSYIHENIIQDVNYYSLWVTVLILDFGASKFHPINDNFNRELEYVSTLPYNLVVISTLESMGPVITIFFLICLLYLFPLIAVSSFLPGETPIFWPLFGYSISLLFLSISINVWSIRHRWVSQLSTMLLIILSYSSLSLFSPEYLKVLRPIRLRVLNLSNLLIFPTNWIYWIKSGHVWFIYFLTAWISACIILAIFILNKGPLYRTNHLFLHRRKWFLLRHESLFNSTIRVLIINIALSSDTQIGVLVLRSWMFAIVMYYLLRVSPVELWGLLALVSFVWIQRILLNVRQIFQGLVTHVLPIGKRETLIPVFIVLFCLYSFISTPIITISIMRYNLSSSLSVVGLLASASLFSAFVVLRNSGLLRTSNG